MMTSSLFNRLNQTLPPKLSFSPLTIIPHLTRTSSLFTKIPSSARFVSSTPPTTDEVDIDWRAPGVAKVRYQNNNTCALSASSTLLELQIYSKYGEKIPVSEADLSEASKALDHPLPYLLRSEGKGIISERDGKRGKGVKVYHIVRNVKDLSLKTENDVVYQLSENGAFMGVIRDGKTLQNYKGELYYEERVVDKKASLHDVVVVGVKKK